MIDSKFFAPFFHINIDHDVRVYEHDRLGRVLLIAKNASSTLDHHISHSPQWRKTTTRHCQQNPSVITRALIREPHERLISGLGTVFTNDWNKDHSKEKLIRAIKRNQLIFDAHTWPQVMFLDLIQPDPSLWQLIPMTKGWQQQVESEWEIIVTEHQNVREGSDLYAEIRTEINQIKPHLIEQMLKPDLELWQSLIE